MSTPNKVVSADVKKQIVDRLKNEGVPVSQLAQEHGLSSRTIYDWLNKGATAPPSWLELNRLKKENQALKELIGQITYQLNMAQKKN